MNKRLVLGLLGAEAVLSAAVAATLSWNAAAVASALAFPYKQIGRLLRSLSLSSPGGNAAAVFVYVILCLSPLALLFIPKKRALRPEDGLAGALCLMLFFCLYWMINPGLMPSNRLMEGAAFQTQISLTADSMLLAYLALRVLRLFFQSGTDKLQRYLNAVLLLLCGLFVFMIFGAGTRGLTDSLYALQAGNTEAGFSLGASRFILILRSLVNALPYVMDLMAVLSAMDLMRFWARDRYSRESVSAAKKLSRLCGRALSITMLASAGFNLLQLLLQSRLNHVSASVEIPLFSIVFVLAILLASRYAVENKALKDDLDGIV